MSRWTKKKSSSNTEYLQLSGLCSYLKAYEPDEFRGAENWKINLHPDDEAISIIKEKGIQLQYKRPKTTPDNIPEDREAHYTFKRPTERSFGDKTTYFCPPAIKVNGEYKVWYEVDGKRVSSFHAGEDPQRVGDPILVGNGSEVTITIEKWHGSMGVGNRLLEIDVTDLIEYTPPEEVDPDEDEAPFEVDEKPKRAAPAKTVKKAAVSW